MGLKETVMEMLAAGRERELVELASSDSRALRPLLGRLWDPDPAVRARAAWAIGQVGALRPERGTEIARRLMWGLNDESATNGVYGVPALGELGRRAPELLAPFVPGLVRFAEDDGLRPAILVALAGVAATGAAAFAIGPWRHFRQ